MSSLDEMIDSPKGLEIKRALAVKMILQDFKTKDICTLLDVSDQGFQGGFQSGKKALSTWNKSR